MWTRGRICVRSPLPSLVTMIEVPVSATRKFAPVMPTSAARKRSRRMARASASRLVGSERSRSGGEMGVDAAEIRLDLVLVQMHRRRDDVARHLAAELDDVFAEVGLDRLDAVLRQMLVQADLLGDHRLALGGGLRADAAADVEDDRSRVLRRLGPMHLAAGLGDLRLIGFEIEVEMVERVVLDGARLLAQAARTPAAPRPPAARLSMKLWRTWFRAPLQLRVGKRLAGVLLEFFGGDLHRNARPSVRTGAG